MKRNQILQNALWGCILLLVPFSAGIISAQAPEKPSDLLITGVMGDPSSPPARITNKKELDMAMDQIADLLNTSPETLNAYRSSYASILAGIPTDSGPSDVSLDEQPVITIDELAKFIATKMVDKVPEFNPPLPEDITGDGEIDPITENRRNAEGVPNTSLVLRRYTSHIIEKYDTNKDNLLQKEEWEKMPGTPQSIDLNGDFVLEEHEILYYLARYAKGRTISHPVPTKKLSVAQTVLKTDGPILIQPLSAPIRKQKNGEDNEDESKDLSDMSQEEFQKIINDADSGAGTEGQSDLFGIVIGETGVSTVGIREYAPSETETEGVPRWFLMRDANGDGQLSLREFSPSLSLESTAFFGRLDTNSDGLVTPDEIKEYTAKGLRPKESKVE